jgi:hypothetical protein
MAYSTSVKVRRDGQIVLKDASTATVSLTVAYEEGNLSLDNLANSDAQTVVRDRNIIVSVRKSDQEPITGSFSFFFRAFTSSDVGSVRDFITGENAYSANVSTGAAGVPFVEHFCVDLQFTVEGTDLGDAADHVATLSKCLCTLSMAEGDPNTWTLNFTAFGGIVYS